MSADQAGFEFEYVADYDEQQPKQKKCKSAFNTVLIVLSLLTCVHGLIIPRLSNPASELYGITEASPNDVCAYVALTDNVVVEQIKLKVL